MCKECSKKIDSIKLRPKYNDVKQYIENLNYTLITTEYKNATTKLTLKDEFGYLYVAKLCELKNNHMPRAFDKCNPNTIQNIKLWLKINNKEFDIIEYNGSGADSIWQCNNAICGEIFTMRWNSIFSGHYNCPFCRGSRVCISNCLATKNTNLASEWHPIKNGDLTPYDVTSNSRVTAWWKCKTCSKSWMAQISNRSKGTGCPYCSSSKGEDMIQKLLNDWNLNHDVQYIFKDLIGINNGYLRFDHIIYKDHIISIDNIFTLIEYQGIQHFESIEFFGGKDRLKKQQYHDQLKNEYCAKNNIKLIRIPYWEFDNIETILQEELKDLIHINN
jgi:hypothetical protein